MSKAREKASEPKIEIDSEVTRCIRQHARLHSKTEVCGVLIGEKDGETVRIQASIEASEAAQGGTHVTFTQEAWEEIYRVKDARYPDDRIVGWYHSHPGFGVFLSEHDMFIQQNFFSSPDQVAWVYDPHTDEEGCFGWVGGEVHRISSLNIADKNGDGVERTPKRMEPALEEGDEEVVERPAAKSSQFPGWMRWSGMALGYFSALVLGFFVSYFFFPSILPVELIPDPASNRIIMAPMSLSHVPPSVLHHLLAGEPAAMQIPPGMNMQTTPEMPMSPAAPSSTPSQPIAPPTAGQPQSAAPVTQPAAPAMNAGGKR